MDTTVCNLLNEQINKELYSAYLYLDMSIFYNDKGLDGFANWFRVQAMEERDHAMIFMTYLQDNGEKPDLLAVAKPDKVFDALIDPLKGALEHEKLVTASINNIYNKASSVNDYRAMQFLEWFIKEQGEEEKSADDLVKKMSLFGEDSHSLYMLNSELSARVYTPAVLGQT